MKQTNSVVMRKNFSFLLEIMQLIENNTNKRESKNTAPIKMNYS
jgi:hypothetical protein